MLSARLCELLEAWGVELLGIGGIELMLDVLIVSILNPLIIWVDTLFSLSDTPIGLLEAGGIELTEVMPGAPDVLF